MKKLMFIIVLIFVNCAVSRKQLSYSSFINNGAECEDIGNYDKALSIYRQAIELSPKSPDGYLAIGRVWYKKDGGWRAKIFLEKAKALGAIAESDLFLSLTALKENRFDEAIKLSENCAKIKPYWTELKFEIGKYFLEKNDYNNAKDYFQQSIDFDKDFWGGHWGIGQILYINKEYDNSLKELNIAYHLDKSFETINGLAKIYCQIGSVAESIFLYTQMKSFELDKEQKKYVADQIILLSDSLYKGVDCNDKTINLKLDCGKSLRVSIYDFDGVIIKTLFEGFLARGNYQFTWDGKDNNGKIKNAGIYLANIQGDDFMETKGLRITQ